MSLFVGGGGERESRTFSFSSSSSHVKETKYELFLEFNDHIISTSKKSKYVTPRSQTPFNCAHQGTRYVLTEGLKCFIYYRLS